MAYTVSWVIGSMIMSDRLPSPPAELRVRQYATLGEALTEACIRRGEGANTILITRPDESVINSLEIERHCAGEKIISN